MTREMTATELKATILSVLDEVAAGAEVEVTKRGRPVARIVPPARRADLHGRFTGIAATAARDDELFSMGVPWESE